MAMCPFCGQPIDSPHEWGTNENGRVELRCKATGRRTPWPPPTPDIKQIC